MRSKLPHVARILLGLPFLAFGINYFVPFMPVPPHAGAAATFLGGLAASGFVFPLMKLTEIAAALMLLSNRFVAFALVLLAPIVVNIVGFHTITEPTLVPVHWIIATLGIYLAYVNRAAYKPLFESSEQARDASAPIAPGRRAPATG